jgi:hypothetical protein
MPFPHKKAHTNKSTTCTIWLKTERKSFLESLRGSKKVSETIYTAFDQSSPGNETREQKKKIINPKVVILVTGLK